MTVVEVKHHHRRSGVPIRTLGTFTLVNGTVHLDVIEPRYAYALRDMARGIWNSNLGRSVSATEGETFLATLESFLGDAGTWSSARRTTAAA